MFSRLLMAREGRKTYKRFSSKRGGGQKISKYMLLCKEHSYTGRVHLLVTEKERKNIYIIIHVPLSSICHTKGCQRYRFLFRFCVKKIPK